MPPPDQPTQRHLVDAAQPADEVDDRVDVGGLAVAVDELVRVFRRAGRGQRRPYQRLLVRRDQVAGVVHHRPARSPVAGHVHREDVETFAGEALHPRIVAIGHVEGERGGREAAVDHEHHLALERRARTLLEEVRGDLLAHEQIDLLSGDGRHGRGVIDQPVDGDEGGGLRGGGGCTKADEAGERCASDWCLHCFLL